MEQLLIALKDYAAIIVACVAAAVSIVNLFWSAHLNEGREQRKVLWERELNRFSEIEDTQAALSRICSLTIFVLMKSDLP